VSEYPRPRKAESMMAEDNALDLINGYKCTAGLRWASLTMDYIGRRIPVDLGRWLSPFDECSCPPDLKRFCEWGHLRDASEVVE